MADHKKLNCISFPTFVRLVAISVSLLACTVSTLIYSFVSFVPAVKAQFNFTQIQVSTIASILMMTALFLFPAGFVYDKVGMLPTVIVAMILSTIGWSGLWLTTLAPHSNPTSFYCVLFSVAFAGHGRSYIDLVAFANVLTMFPTKHRAVAILLAELSLDFGNFIFNLMYETCFSQSKGKDINPLNQNLAGFLCGALIISFICNMLITGILPSTQKYKPAETDSLSEGEKKNVFTDITTKEKTTDDATSSYQNSDVKATNEKPTKPKLYQDIITKTFVFLAITFSINMTISSFTQTNLTLVTQSLSLSKLNYYMIILQRPAVTTSKLLFTASIVATTKFKFSREFILVAISLVVTASQILLLVKADNAIIFVTAYACVYLSHGATMVAGANLISTVFSFERFGVNYGLMMGCMPFMTTIVQMIFGKLYDSEILEGDGIYCTGKHCTYKFYQVTTALCCLSILAAVGLLITQISRWYKTKV